MKTTKCKWTLAPKTPWRKGWYITRTKDGDIQYRAWGNGAWWKQIEGGWFEWFDGNGEAIRYDYLPRTRQSIDLNSNELPAIDAMLSHRAKTEEMDK